ncbi:hypothetical protein JHK86_016160 [Glycine max]|nr:hypothetical protein JHK86_016160 [Glycine max]
MLLRRRVRCLKTTGFVQKPLKISADLSYLYPKVENAGCGANWYNNMSIFICLGGKVYLQPPCYCAAMIKKVSAAALYLFPSSEPHQRIWKKGCCCRADIKMWNVILNGWCVLGNLHEAKRVWRDIVASPCKPHIFTYATFIKALTKKGKLGTALKLFRGMWGKGGKPDVVICNCIIDALCFKKRIPDVASLN